MQDKKPVALYWSGGKDAAMAYFLLSLSEKFTVTCLVTHFSEFNMRVSMHGTRASVIELQASRMNLPLKKILLPENVVMEDYEMITAASLKELKGEGIAYVAYGDISLEDLKAYKERQLAKEGLQGLFPLWGRNTRDMVEAVEKAGIEAIIVAVAADSPGLSFLGERVDRQLINRLPALTDPCGENGEYHTLVLNAPFFTQPIRATKGAIAPRSYAMAGQGQWNSSFYFLDIIPDL